MRKRVKRRGVVYQKMVRSILLTMIAPLVMTIAVHYYSVGILEKQTKEANRNFLYTIQSVCDKEIRHYQNAISQFSWNERIRTIGLKDKFDPDTQIQAAKLMSSLYELFSTQSNYSDSCKDIFVYFPRVNRILSTLAHGSVAVSTYADSVLGMSQQEQAWMYDAFNDCKAASVTGIRMEKSNAERLLIMLPAARSAGKVNAVLGIWVDQRAMTDTIKLNNGQANSDWLIVDREHNVIKAPKTIAVQGTFEPTNFDGMKDYVTDVVTSEATNLTYVLLTPQHSVNRYAKYIQLFVAAAIMVSMLAEFFLLRKAIRVNYAPLERLVKMVQQDEESQRYIDNEYAYLGQSITRMQEHQENLRQRISLKNDALKKLFVTNVLLKPFSGEVESDVLRQFVAQFEKKQTMVVLMTLHFEQSSAGIVLSAEDMKALVDDMLTDAAYATELVEVENQMVLLIGGDDSELTERKARHALEEVQKLLCDELALSVDISMGEPHDGLDGIHISYLEALEASEFLSVLEQNMIPYREIMDATARRYDYSVDTEERIIQTIQTDNDKLAETLVNRVLDMNFKENRLDATLRRCLTIHLYCTLLRAADEKGMISAVEVPATVFRTVPSPELLKKQYARIIERICAQDRGNTIPNLKRELCSQVLEYVKANYNDSALNISSAAQHFHVSPSKLGAVFKKETGKSLLDVIRDTRMEAALTLLQDGLSVNECARKVGIEDTTTFIRQFKKYIGKTPAQMRTELRGSDTE